MGMMVGVAVGWALDEELGTTDRIETDKTRCGEREEKTMEINYHGHSCFELSDGETRCSSTRS